MVRRSGQQGVPVIIVGDKVIVGFDRPRLERAIGRLNGQQSRAQSRPRFGAAVADAAPALARRGQTPMVGALVGRVTAKSAADRAGLQPGDVVIEINGRPIASARDLEEMVGAANAGDQLTLTVVRAGQSLRLSARL